MAQTGFLALSWGVHSPLKLRLKRSATWPLKAMFQRKKKNTATFKSWSNEHGFRRLSNILIELERVLELPARGQAILQAQALTRFIILHLDKDIAAFKRAVSSSN